MLHSLHASGDAHQIGAISVARRSVVHQLLTGGCYSLVDSAELAVEVRLRLGQSSSGCARLTIILGGRSPNRKELGAQVAGSSADLLHRPQEQVAPGVVRNSGRVWWLIERAQMVPPGLRPGRRWLPKR